MGFSDFSADVPTVNLMHGGRGWGTFGATAPLDSFGYPTSLPNGAISNIVTLTDQGRDLNLPKGVYDLIWNGQSTFNCTDPGVTYTQVSNTASGGRATLNYQGGNIFLQWTALNPSNRTTDIKLLMPGTEATYATNPFYEPWVKRLRFADCIRTMDWFNTNVNLVQNWSDRTTLQHATQQRTQGTCLELSVQLANHLYQTGNLKVWWVNVPVAASNDYVTQMATYIKNNLNTNIKIVIELGNEIWNYAFTTTGNYMDTFGRTIASYPESDNWRYRLAGYSHRCCEVFAIWRSVWADSLDRLNCTVNVQTGNTGITDIILQHAHPTHGKLGNFADSMATAPYFDAGLNDYMLADFSGQDNTKVQNILSRSTAQCMTQLATGSLSELNARMDADLGYRNSNFPSLGINCYEGGPHLYSEFLAEDKSETGATVGTFAQSARGKITTKFRLLNQHPEFEQINLDYLNQAKVRMGSGIFCYYGFVSPDKNAPDEVTKFGYWGAQEGTRQPMNNCPKLKGVILAAGRVPADYE